MHGAIKSAAFFSDCDKRARALAPDTLPLPQTTIKKQPLLLSPVLKRIHAVGVPRQRPRSEVLGRAPPRKEFLQLAIGWQQRSSAGAGAPCQSTWPQEGVRERCQIDLSDLAAEQPGTVVIG